jgi:hypothetical protein
MTTDDAEPITIDGSSGSTRYATRRIKVAPSVSVVHKKNVELSELRLLKILH